MLAILVIVLPAAMNLKLLSWRVSSPNLYYQFTMIGFGAALFFDFILMTLVKMRKSRRALCAKWAVVQTLLGIFFFLMWRGTIHFDWVKDWVR